MKFDIITIFPEMFESVFQFGIISQAIKNNLIDIKVHNLRDYTDDKHKQVDDRPFGGGVGMVLMPEPLFKAIEDIKKSSISPTVVFMTPQGKSLNQELVEELSVKPSLKHYIIICGRYEGIDQRVRDQLVDLEVSIGNYVLSGGEFGSMIFVDAITRLVPGVIKNDEFNDSESFSDPNDRLKLDFPQYTRPAELNGLNVPEVLLSGNHEEIRKWRENNRA